MATTKEIAEKWGVKPRTVADYCASGMVPSADKTDGIWDIPLDTPKPYCTSYKAAQYLKHIKSIQEGASPNISLICSDSNKNVDCIDFLGSIGFCSKVKWINCDGQIDFDRSLSNVIITADGNNLIVREQRKQEKEESAELEVGAYGEVSIGIAKVGGSINKKVSN